MTYEPSKEAVSKTHWPDPTPEMLDQPDFNAIGNHARAILDALTPVLAVLIAGHEDAAIPEGWQPIETAPRDGTEIIGCHSTDWSDIGLAPAIYGPWTMVFARDNWRSSWGRSQVINYMSDDGEIEYAELEAAPTHWMPLLPPPTPETKK
jgi:hypothetical protein